MRIPQLALLALCPSCLSLAEDAAIQQGVVHYLEIVTPEVDQVCATYAATIGVEFGEPDVALGSARTATLPDGSTLGVRAPMHAQEEPATRPYFLVPDIEAAVATAEAAGAMVALPPMEIPGHGICAIYFQGGVQFALWEL
ncbi:MAG: hydroxylase [Planctomycetota bacterium]|nr:hydroxylase [Planctomycetota bacterium]